MTGSAPRGQTNYFLVGAGIAVHEFDGLRDRSGQGVQRNDYLANGDPNSCAAQLGQPLLGVEHEADARPDALDPRDPLNEIVLHRHGFDQVWNLHDATHSHPLQLIRAGTIFCRQCDIVRYHGELSTPEYVIYESSQGVAQYRRKVGQPCPLIRQANSHRSGSPGRARGRIGPSHVSAGRATYQRAAA